MAVRAEYLRAGRLLCESGLWRTRDRRAGQCPVRSGMCLETPSQAHSGPGSQQWAYVSATEFSAALHIACEHCLFACHCCAQARCRLQSPVCRAGRACAVAATYPSRVHRRRVRCHCWSLCRRRPPSLGVGFWQRDESEVRGGGRFVGDFQNLRAESCSGTVSRRGTKFFESLTSRCRRVEFG